MTFCEEIVINKITVKTVYFIAVEVCCVCLPFKRLIMAWDNKSVIPDLEIATAKAPNMA